MLATCKRVAAAVLAPLRWLHGSEQENIVLELYHATNSVCAQKVRLALAEKRLSAKEHLLTLNGDQYDPAYLKLNPNGVVPTLVHDGHVVTESTIILYYLDDAFPETS